MRWTDRFDWQSRTFVMGILNATPDSFSGDGVLSGVDAVASALSLARAQLEAGADILDIGGESTRPGALPLDAPAECARVVPVIEAVRAAFPDAILSIDTYRAAVAAAALDAGANIVNDVWALRGDPDMAGLLAAREVPVILMHNRSRPDDVSRAARIGAEYRGANYRDVVDEAAQALLARIDAAVAAGIARDRIVVDPGIGFGKTVTQNLALINHLPRLKEIVDCPILVGPSRKSFIGRILDVAVEDRLEGTAAAVAASAMRDADIVRVHDVKEMVRVVRVIDRLKAAPADGGGSA
ncbi:MAG: dihydropteroate synthase [Rickettsiales bacterium]